MLPKINAHLETVPFRPFAVRTVDGREYPVPTVDHIYLLPGTKDIIVADDKVVTVRLSAFYITDLVEADLPARAGDGPSEL